MYIYINFTNKIRVKIVVSLIYLKWVFLYMYRSRNHLWSELEAPQWNTDKFWLDKWIWYENTYLLTNEMIMMLLYLHIITSHTLLKVSPTPTLFSWPLDAVSSMVPFRGPLSNFLRQEGQGVGAVWVVVGPGDSCLGEGVVPSYREAGVSSPEVGADLQSQIHMITFHIKPVCKF